MEAHINSALQKVNLSSLDLPNNQMQKKLKTHLISIFFVGILFLIIHMMFPPETEEEQYMHYDLIQKYTNLDFLDLNSPEDRMLLRESLDIYDPQNTTRHDSLLIEIEKYLTDRMISAAGSRQVTPGIDIDRFINIFTMLLKFAIIYVFVLLVTYYCVETFAVYRFIRNQNRKSFMKYMSETRQRFVEAQNIKEKSFQIIRMLGNTGRRILRALIMLTLFAPAYVIAYSFKTRFDTNSLLVMIILSVISNGLLITYMQKFYTFLAIESQKGYVKTAIVKNLNPNLSFHMDKGISLSSIFRLNKKFPGHIFDQIYENVRYQYLNTLKEQASFLITGLIIIEMALNIQGYLCYELMQNILYKNLAVILLILFGIFLIVKLTQIIIDIILYNQQRKIGNISPEESG